MGGDNMEKVIALSLLASVLLLASIMDSTEACTVRLIGANGQSNTQKGRLEVYMNDQWGTVCDDDDTKAYRQQNNNMAMVVCRMLGKTGVKVYNEGEHSFTGGSGPTLLDDVMCSGTESSIFDCPRRLVGENCDHAEDVAIECSSEKPFKTDGFNEAKTMIGMLGGNTMKYLVERSTELLTDYKGVQDQLKAFYGAIPAQALYDLHVKTLKLMLSKMEEKCGKVELKFYPLHPGLDEEEKLRTWKHDDGVDSILDEMMEKLDENSCKLAEHRVPSACEFVQRRVPVQFSLSRLGEALRKIFFTFDTYSIDFVKTMVPMACEAGKRMVRNGIKKAEDMGPEKYKSSMCMRFWCD